MIATLIYFAGVLLCMYPFSMAFVKAVCGDGKIDSMDRGFSIFFGGVFAILWPVVLGIFLVYHASKRIWKKVVGEETREKHRV